LFFHEIKLSAQASRQGQCQKTAEWIAGFSEKTTRLYIYQYSEGHDPDIVYDLKKAYSRIAIGNQDRLDSHKKPYLDKL